jgi:CRISPR-associated protein Cmr3
MSTWIIEPRDPLIARDGRPFGPNPGVRATSNTFPFPSTTTGGVRTRTGSDANGHFDVNRIAEVKKVFVRGPLLVQLNVENVIDQWLAPAPGDALLLATTEDGVAMCKQLVPLHMPKDSMTDLSVEQNLVGMPNPVPDKPLQRPPRYWYWSQFADWLSQPESSLVNLKDLGTPGPVQERRTHVRILNTAQTADEGALFQTQGLEFAYADRDSAGYGLQTVQRFALAVATDANLHGGLGALGGERRTVTWRQSNVSLPEAPDGLFGQISEQGACRLVLLTPACFTNGYQPSFLLQPQHGVTPHLQGLALPRYQVVSGWDFEIGKPKPTRRLAPAGTVLFLKLNGDKAAIKQWAKQFWLQTCVSDKEQDRLDGFGLAALGVWSGEPATMEVKL